MVQKLSVLIIYLIITLIIGFIFRKVSGKSSIEFFLAGRKLGKLLLFFTLSATNFSAFTIFGFSGAGYRMGYAFYPVMGFGTAFMALSFYIIGEKIMILSKKRNYITPSDFIFDRYRSRFLQYLISGIMIIFTLPYISIQAISAGKALNSLTGIPYFSGALLITLFVILYVTTGGMRSIVWTDLIQGIMMVVLTTIGFFMIIKLSGGLKFINQELFNKNPEYFSITGKNGVMTPGIFIGYMLLWFFADPMFPHLFQRFIATKDRESLRLSMTLYPLITTFLFFITVSIGIVGRYNIPDLAPSQTDAIFSILLERFLSPVLAVVLFTGGMAALMSTMDSQMLTLTSIISVDLLEIERRGVKMEKLILVAIGIFSLIIAYNPPATILSFIRKTTFNGLGVLAPSFIGGIYWKRGNRIGASFSIITGEILVILFYIGILKTPGLLPFITIILTTTVVYITASLLTLVKDNNISITFRFNQRDWRWLSVFAFVFLLGNLPIFSVKSPAKLHWMGLPGWIWYYFTLGVLLSILFSIFSANPAAEKEPQIS